MKSCWPRALRQLCFISREKVENLEMLAEGSRTGIWYNTIAAQKVFSPFLSLSQAAPSLLR